MIVYTYSEARQNFATLLDKAAQEGEVRVKRKDGQVFVIRPAPRQDSPLDVAGIDLGLTVSEILQFIQEGRRPSS
jgi:antitoxin (DNA-binding transcriptional repressor) of toxin-antitoxin stability system